VDRSPRSPASAPPVPGSEAGAPPAVVLVADPWSLALRIVTLAVAMVAAIWLALLLQAVLMRLLVAIILATGLYPLVQRLHRAGLPRVLAVLLIYLTLILLLVALLLLVVPPLVEQVGELLGDWPRYNALALEVLHDLQRRFPFLPPLDTQLAQQLQSLGSQLGAIASQVLVVAQFALNVFSGVVSAVLVLLITLYLIVDGPRIREYPLSFFAPPRRDRLRLVLNRMGERMGGWLLGQLILSATIGLFSFVGLTLLGVKGAVLLAAIAAVGEAIPLVGPILSAVPAIVVAGTESLWQAGATLVLYVVIQQLENNLLVPKVMERAVALHPLAVVLALITGGELLGIGGALVAVPVAAALAVALDELRPRDPPGAAEAPAATPAPEAMPAAAQAAEDAPPPER